MLELEFKPDAQRALERMEAWWEMEILDRPAVQVVAPRPNPRPVPERRYASVRDRWLDAEGAVERSLIHASNTYWGGEILPAFWPNLGPEILSAAYGADLEFGPDTSWSVPCLDDWSDLPDLAFDSNHPLIEKLLEMTRLALDAGGGKWVVGITDLHPGADLAASFRDPRQLCLDLALEPERVHELMDRIRPAFTTLYELQYGMMRAAGQTVTTSWLPLFTDGRYYIPSCDFSCMVSLAMFREFFLPEIVEEIEWLDRSIYHLDGPGALKDLDTLLEIPKLGAIQWVWGAGKGRASDWLPVFRRIQAAGKGMHIGVGMDEIDLFMNELRPEGVMLSTWAPSVEAAESVIEKVSRWPR